MVVSMSADTTSNTYDSHRRPFLLLTGEGVANHRDGGCDPTELPLTVQPANTARPVETIIPQPVMGGVKPVCSESPTAKIRSRLRCFLSQHPPNVLGDSSTLMSRPEGFELGPRHPISSVRDGLVASAR